MGLTTDAVGIQFRVATRAKRSAVRGSRAQIDMDRYRVYMRNFTAKYAKSRRHARNRDAILTQTANIGRQTHLETSIKLANSSSRRALF